MSRPSSVHVIGYPFSGGQHRVGVETGPQHIRSAGLIEEIKDMGYEVVDHGDLDVDTTNNVGKSHQELTDSRGAGKHGHIRNVEGVAQGSKALHEACFNAAEKGGENAFVLAVGGDHSMAIGSISGILRARPNTSVIWCDAHADLNTPATSPSGNIHGMPVAYLGGIASEPAFDPVLGHSVKLDLSERIAYIGLRDLDEGEKEFIKKHNILAFTASDLEKQGIERVMQLILQRINPDGSRFIHLSFDIDGVDPVFAPSTGTPVAGGVTHREARVMCEAAFATGRLRSMDMTEVNPQIAPEGATKTVKASIEFVLTALGRVLL